VITRQVKIQLAIFGALTLIAMTLIVFVYVKVPAIVGIGQHSITADFTDGGGIYPFANVTYRGVTVGKVKSVGLDGGNVAVKMSISSSADVPSNVTASIKSVSAIGEQYVDLVPPSGEEGEMPVSEIQSGAVIDVSRTSIPVPIAKVLDDVDTLVSAVPIRSLDVVLNESSQAFDGIGPSMSELIDSTQKLLDAADEHHEATSALIDNAEVVIDSQIATAPAIRSWTADLRSFTKDLSENDSHVRALLDTVPGAADQAKGTLRDLGETVPVLADSSQILAELAVAYHVPIEQILNALPRGLATMLANARPDRDYTFSLALRTIVDSPGVCSTMPKSGTKYGPRGPHQLSDLELAPNSYCKIPQSDPRVARGARNLECFEPGSPPGRRAATIYQCRGGGYDAAGTDPDPNAPIIVGNPVADIGTGLLGDVARGASASPPGSTGGGETWQSLLLRTVQ
jgi:phospholipid/cholesterol/gamma-HCH transport system substrate-binding protein